MIMALFKFTLALLSASAISALGDSHQHSHRGHHPHHRHNARDAGSQQICLPIPTEVCGYEDMAAKIRPRDGTCRPDESLSNRPILSTGMERRQATDDPYSCNENKPCSNGACCAKSGFCGYGPDYCGTNGQSPNDVCWSNCDAHAECGRYAEEEGKTCPLNVCCSQFGFCGSTEEFCAVRDDEETSCQSNCEQPGSGASGGDVQKRIIGYYEAWNYKKKCIGMGMQDIPVGSLTHLYYSFGYIRPETYDIVPMDDGSSLPESTFSDFTNLKRKNSALKVVVALGGWTFNDNGTIWQPVFSDLVSTQAKRSRFIDKLMMFLTRYGFDGVDLDWEYPGAPDRGGHPDDGVNFTKLLKEMRAAFDKMGGSRKEISFTAPTSYWYLRHFDIKASVEASDFVNVMSYDLHGIWDANNPIGPTVLAHSNITEIKLALDLFWRTDVPAGKINMGLGFYGRSFQLADPGCFKPGCVFKGGAAPGPCTENSGTLSYREIMDIIEEKDLTPYHDEENAVKWITWGGDQWVSYDDFDTFQQKIEFANNLGLGGLLIWAIDLDTLQLDALSAVLYPERLGMRAEESNADNWQDADGGQCRVTDCGVGTCGPGEITVTHQQCSGTDFWDGGYYISTLCCPLSSAPDPEKCQWRGDRFFDCNGYCEAGEVALQSSKWGGERLAPCSDGRMFYCCEAEAAQPDCHWTDCDGSCGPDEDELTWRYGDCRGDAQEKFCCKKDEGWSNCAWHGKPGSCFDNHCDTGWQVSLTTSYEGEGEDCGFWGTGPERSFCCDPKDGTSPFLPVPLEYLFENPPPEDTADTEFSLKVDPTYGGSTDVPFNEDPSNSAFGFVVLASPETIQVSLDKRDGSHWDIFDCVDAVTEGEHTVRMVCTDDSETSNCHKIHLGQGAPGTIIQMPEGCGPGKYAVTKSLSPSRNQSIPGHLSKRDLPEKATVFDLTFDYDFRRVPRQAGEETQMRIDFSNEPEYWDTIVNRAADKKRRKRSLEDVGGNHKRWLEDEWRDDAHFGALSSRELHKRWFGEDIIAWLREIINGVRGGIDLSHSYSDQFVVKLVDERLSCPNFDARLDIRAETSVDLDVNYGFTLIATLGTEGSLVDLSKSYLYFRSRGDVTSKFILDAGVTAHFDTGDILLLSADRFGAAFAVPGIVTIGPNFKLFGQLEGEATIGVNFEATAKVAQWDARQTFPVANDEYDPEVSGVEKTGTQLFEEPEFDFNFRLNGHVSAHIKPTVTFGIDFNKNFLPIDSCAVNLVADGHITFHAELQPPASFCYGVDAGADLYASLDAPSAFSWALPKSPFPILPVDTVQIYPTNGEQACWTPGASRARARSISAGLDLPLLDFNSSSADADSPIHKRANVYGPLVPRLPGLRCPGSVDLDDIPACPLCYQPGSEVKRQDGGSGEVCDYDPFAATGACPSERALKRTVVWRDVNGTLIAEFDESAHSLEKRDTEKTLSWVYNGQTYTLPCGFYKPCGEAKSQSGVLKWYGFRDMSSTSSCSTDIEKLTVTNIDPGNFVTEHIFEVQLLTDFMNWLTSGKIAPGYTAASRAWVSEVLLAIVPPNGQNRNFAAPGWKEGSLFYEMTYGLGGNSNPQGLALADKYVNGRKKLFFQGTMPSSDNEDSNLKTRRHHRNTAGVFNYMRHPDIWNRFVASSQFMEQKCREFDQAYPWNTNNANTAGQPGLPVRAAGQPAAGLRDLYVYWIDVHLATIEASGSTWFAAARQKYAASSYGQDDAGKKWLASEMSPTGAISDMRLSRAGVSHAVRGANQIWTASNYDGLWRTGTGYGAAGPF